MLRVLILNGPNLDVLGTREPHFYGDRSFEDYLVELRAAYPHVAFTYVQSNAEGVLVERLRAASADQDAVVLNAAGYSHTSVALRDSITVVELPVVEVHISNIHGREDFRHRTLTGAVCDGVVTGFGLDGYRLAVDHLLRRVRA